MANVYKDFWMKDDKVSFYREILNHTFHNCGLYDTNISFDISKKGSSKISDPLLVSVCDSFERMAGDSVFTIRFEDSITAAKKMIDDTIKVFDQKQNVDIYQIKDYFSFHINQTNNLRNAAAFVDHFDHDQPEYEQTQGKTPPLERRNINSKENIMSDERTKGSQMGDVLSAAKDSVREITDSIVANQKRQEVSAQIDDYLNDLKGNVLPGNLESDENTLSPKEKAFREAVINATFQRKVVADAIKNGTLACLPGADGYADTTPAVNIMTPQKPYHGDTQLFLKAFQKQEQNGFPTAEYVTYHQIDKCRESGVDVYVRQGQKGVSLLISEKKEEAGDWETKKIRLFNVAQLNSPKLIKDWAEKQIAEQAKKDLEYKQMQYGSGYKPPEAKPKEPGPEIVCTSTEPEKYLGQYLAAVSMGSKFKVSPEQSAEFSEKMVKALYVPMEPRRNEQTGEVKPPPLNKETGQPITDCFSLEKISRAANKECVEFMRNLGMAAQKQNQPVQKQEQTQSIGGRSM